MDRSGQTFFYHQNTLWSVEAITDSSANVVERYSYDAYGLPTILNGSGVPISLNSWGTPHSAIGNPWMFIGRQFDEETGAYFYRARHYDVVKGRFLQRDPFEYMDGMNLYEYVHDSPITRLDPAGFLMWNNLDAVFTTVNDTEKIIGRLGATTLQKEKAWGLTAPRINVSGNCQCPSQWPWLENVRVTSISIGFYSEVYLLPKYELKGFNSDDIRNWVLRAEGDHVSDFLDWANTKGKKLAEDAENQLKRERYYFLSGCAEEAGRSMYAALLPSLETAAENTNRKHDPPSSRRHDFGSLSRRP
jgi:RHS repeat-associated protein